MTLIISRFIAGVVDSHPYLPSSRLKISDNLPLRTYHAVTMPTLKANMGRRHSAFRKKFGDSVLGPAGVPRRDLLDQPRITVGIIEGEERPVARALGIGAGKPCLRGERHAVPHLTRVDATADEFVMSRFDVGGNQRRRGRARRRRS